MRKHLPAKAQIAKLNKSTESEVTELTSSRVNETALAILRRQGGRGIRVVRSQRKMIFCIYVKPYWLERHAKLSKLAAEDFETSEFHQDTWHRHLMLECVSVNAIWKAISRLDLQRSYEALRTDLVLPSAMSVSNNCRSECALTVDGIKKQLPSGNKVSFVLDRWTSANKPAITSVIVYYIDWNWALHEVQLAFDEVDHLSYPFSKAN